MFKSNIEMLPDAITFAHDIGMDRVAASHMYVFNERLREESLINHQALSDSVIYQSSELAKDLGLEFIFPRTFDRNSISTTTIFQHGICSYLYKEAWIHPNGRVHPCFMPDSPVMGDMKEQSFKEIWNGEKYQELRTSLKEGKPSYYRCGCCPIRMQFDPDFNQGYDISAFMIPENGRG